MAGRVLLVMEGGHPWGFRIEGGAEVQQPIRINKVNISVSKVIRGITSQKRCCQAYAYSLCYK